ncbi:MAG TPA: DUF4328 domain-containing protein [Chitinophagaceae bacterium]|nr:DUF4328 domain-containing protein [Chitinophagaceae bacterium]
MHPISPNKQRAKQIISIFYIVLVMTIIQTAHAVWQYIAVDDFIKNPSAIDLDLANQVDFTSRIVGLLAVTLRIVTIVFFIRWFRRAYNNLHAIAPEEASQPEGWAAGAWFVPILNLFRPYQIMKEIWVGTQKAMPHRFPSPVPPTLVGIWWAAFLAMSIMGNIATRLGLGASRLDEWLTASTVLIVADVLAFPAVFLAIQLVKKMSDIEDQLWDEAQTPSDSVFAPIPIESVDTRPPTQS